MTNNYNNVPGNYYDKFNAANPLVKWMMAGFKRSLLTLTERISFDLALEIGCGEGYIQALLQAPRMLATDIDFAVVESAASRYPQAQYFVADGTQLPLQANSFDLVLAIEVLEHVPQPLRLLREARRLSRRYAIFSVPSEPLWRVLNMARGRYWADLGNTPGHVNHWTPRAFTRFVGEEFTIIEVQQPLPWTMLLCEVK